MKIYISVDIEGINGINSWDETFSEKNAYRPFQVQMTNEVKIVCEALKEQGINDIVIRDAHGSSRNLIAETLPDNVQLIRGWSGGLCDMMFGLDASFDGIIYIGYHDKALSKGNFLGHTMTTQINYVKINDQQIGEYDINTFFAKTLKVPVIMLSGDKSLCEDKESVNSHLVTVPAFEGFYGATKSVHPNKHAENLRKAVKEALANLKFGVEYDLAVPAILKAEISYRDCKSAYTNSFFPGAVLVEPNAVTYTAHNYTEILKFFKFCL
ncbi:MAG: M55 family metallopeptidase [Erysipelotrichales bacterium]|nr:M55 family metallopeptidase [Erysipelotrichales bacterium]